MKITIQAIGKEVTPDMELFITKKLQILSQYHITVIRAEIIVGEDLSDGAKSEFCNIRMLTTGTGYLVAQSGDTWKESVTAAVNELERKISNDSNAALN